jgi:hypothetical protein
MALALSLLVAAWQVSADTCDGRPGARDCGATRGVAVASWKTLFPGAAANSDDVTPLMSLGPARSAPSSSPSQSASFFLFGVGLALVARSLKRQQSVS